MSWVLSLLGFGGEPPSKVTVQLIPDADARSLPGFHHGGLTLIAIKGTSFRTLLDNFNTYRGPDSQILNLFSGDGRAIPLDTIISAPVVVHVRKI